MGGTADLREEGVVIVMCSGGGGDGDGGDGDGDGGGVEGLWWS